MSPRKNLKIPNKPGEEVQTPKNVRQILYEQIELGLKEYRRSDFGLFLSAFAAGLEIGFSVYLMGILYTSFHEALSPAVLHLLMAAAYPVGFIFTILGRSELFTEHTTRAVLPVLNKLKSIKDLVKLWAIVFLANLAGGFIFAAIVSYFTPVMETISKETFVYIANKVLNFKWHVILFSAVGAGWLMGLLSWLVSSAQETISRIFIIIIITFLIGFGGLHHSILGSVEVFAGMLRSSSITFMDFLHFISWTTLGNAIGGVFFVAVIKFSHTIRSED